MTPFQATKQAFQECRKNHEKSRAVASYLSQQHLLNAGVTQETIDESKESREAWLDAWYESRANDSGYVPEENKIVHS